MRFKRKKYLWCYTCNEQTDQEYRLLGKSAGIVMLIGGVVVTLLSLGSVFPKDTYLVGLVLGFGGGFCYYVESKYQNTPWCCRKCHQMNPEHD